MRRLYALACGVLTALAWCAYPKPKRHVANNETRDDVRYFSVKHGYRTLAEINASIADGSYNSEVAETRAKQLIAPKWQLEQVLNIESRKWLMSKLNTKVGAGKFGPSMHRH